MTPASTLDHAHLPRAFQALADPTRLAILHRLGRGERCVCDLQDLLDAAQSRLSFHLRVLKEAGLITGRRDGRWSYYRANLDALEGLKGAVEGLADPPSKPEEPCCGA